MKVAPSEIAAQRTVRRAGRYSSEDVHRALFALPPRRRSLTELRAGIAQLTAAGPGRSRSRRR